MRFLLDVRADAALPPADLDERQRSVVAHRTGPLLVLAGPGTGKTTTIVEAICSRLEDPVDPMPAEAVLALTFGRKAATELRDRVTARLGGGAVPTVATFHSFAYALLRLTDDPEDYPHPPRLMSGAEEDVRIRTLLEGAVEDGTIDWPADLAGALPTLGLANEVRAVLARARELGLEGDELRERGVLDGRPAWVAIGQLARQEQEVMALENVMDYTELLWQAYLRASDPRFRDVLHRRYRAIYVDEYQDTDPLQVKLLAALVGPGCSIVAVGDPDQSIYAFRGADVHGLERFPEQFRTAAGHAAPVVVLRECRRFGPVIRAAAAAVIARTRVGGAVPRDRIAEHRAPVCAPRAHDAVEVRSYDDEGAAAAYVADGIRLARVQRSVPWSRLAVLVRTGNQIPRLQRALEAAGIPFVVAADEIPLRSEPAVAVLLSALRLATSPASASPAEIIDVLTGPLVGLTGSDIRRLGRALRDELKQSGVAVAPSDQLIGDLVVGVPHRSPFEEHHPLTHAVGRLRILLADVQRQLADGASPEDALWTVWTGGRVPHGWSNRLRSAALAGSRSAGHDLDAVIALFDAAERFTGRFPGFAGMGEFLNSLDAQQIPAEPVSDRGTDVEAVRILTAHRAKGLEWDEVWVVGAQEGVWPDLRARGTTLRAEELGAEGIAGGPTPAQLLAEERRLFYVACTRARSLLHVAVIAPEGDEREQPSRFIDDLLAGLAGIGLETTIEHVGGRPVHPVSLTGLVGRLRDVAQDPRQPAGRREAAIERLAMLMAARDEDDEPLVPLADPRRWWGALATSVGPRAVRDPRRPLALSGSALDSILACPLQWFLDREVHAETPRGTATAFGSVVHAVADFVAKGEVPADLELMDAEVDRIWPELRFEAPWQSQAERSEAHSALERFLTYHLRSERTLEATELGVGIEIDVPTPGGGTDTVALSGYIDRVERDADGRLVPIDLKNMRFPVRGDDLPEYGQLGVYQLILREGGATPRGAEPRPESVGGAELVQLRVPAGKGSPMPKQQVQPSIGDGSPTWIEERLGEAAAIVRSEVYPAIVGSQCRYCAFASLCPAQPEGADVSP